MDPDDKKAQPERDQTDESLRTERKNSDEVMAERLTDIEDADDLLKRAREEADQVLDAARDKADVQLDAAELGAQGRDDVEKARALADQVLQDERATADEVLRREREEQVKSLAALLPLEREKTDRYLFTERARSDTELANRDDFMGMVSHDLRNLLSGIVMNATVLARKAPDTDEGRRTIAGMKGIERYVARANRLIGDLVDVVSIDAGKLAVRPERCDGCALLSEAIAAFAHAAAEKGISLDSDSGDSALPVDLDHERMLQVFANVIGNAVKFTPRGGAIRVRAERVAEHVQFSVIDTGTGIPSNMLHLVFERFWQVGKDDKRGLGLGLYISKCIVDAHGGKIWAESTEGKGTVFHFTIPAELTPTP